MLYDSDFLKELDESREKTTYVKIISLDWDENPIEEIEGKITQGSVNIDGNSAVRRTCSLSLVAEDINIHDYYWGLNTKFKFEIGLKNTVSKENYYDYYPDIIWFKMGTYVITNFSSTLNTNSYVISISGKDKMCLLNGEIGGSINATTDFGTYDYTDENGVTINRKYPIKQIIWDAVHAYANEPFYNIIINDLDELGLELLEYKYDVPLYLFYNPLANKYVNYTLDGETYIWYKDGNSYSRKRIKNLKYFKELVESLVGENHTPSSIYLNNPEESDTEELAYNVAKIEYGQTVGYRTCDLIYPGDLIANVGDSFTSILDKIKSMLGAFEYFYDLDGRFVFQRQKSLVNTDWSPQHRTSDGELYVESLALASNSMYQFSGSILISSFQNQPNLLNLRNDYTVWGVRQGVNGQEYPIHMRYAIDNKPTLYVNHEGKAFTVYSEEEIKAQNDAKAISAKEYIISQLESFDKRERSPSFYEGIEDNSWWEIEDWAEYYKILMGEYPGVNHPEDEMMHYANNKGTLTELRNYYINQNIYDPTDIGGTFSNLSHTMEIFIYENPTGKKAVRFHSHPNCIHTYGEFLEAKTYITNQGNTQTVDWKELNTPKFLHGENTIYGSNGMLRLNHVLEGDLAPEKSSYFNVDNTLINGQYRLVDYACYVYDPEIPEDKREQRMSEIEEKIEYVDPNAGNYIYDLDWRELIYQMAIDYRRYNHEDRFEIDLAAHNYPNYPNGKTGYEQYYTDLEGFWRQLYFPIYDEEDEKNVYELEYITYRQIVDTSNYKNIYIKGMYVPISQKVKCLERAEAKKNYNKNLIWPPSIHSTNCIIHKEGTRYYTSTDNGINFFQYRPNSVEFEANQNYENALKDNWEEVLSLAEKGQLFIRDANVFDPSTLYFVKEGEMHPFMDQFNYISSEKQHFLKVVDSEDPENPSYNLITEEDPILTSNQRAESYIIINSTAYNKALEDLEDARKEYNELIGEAADVPIEEQKALEALYSNLYLAQMEFAKLEDKYQFENLAYSKAMTYYQSLLSKKEEIENQIEQYKKDIKSIESKVEKTTNTQAEGDKKNKALEKLNGKIADYTRLKKNLEDNLTEIKSQITKQKAYINGSNDEEGLKVKLKNAKQAMDNYKIETLEPLQERYNAAKDMLPEAIANFQNALNKLHKTPSIYGLYKNNLDSGLEPTLLNSYLYKDDYFCLEDLIKAYEFWKARQDNSSHTRFYRDLLGQYCDISEPSEDIADNVYTLKQKIIKHQLLNTGAQSVNEDNEFIHYYMAYTNFYIEDNLPQEEEKRLRYWNKNIFTAPHTLNFWFDFLVGDDELREFTTQAIGDRPKAIKEDTIKSIYYRDTPKIIFYTPSNIDESRKTGYDYIQVSNMNMFSISPQGIDAKNKIDELIYQYSYCINSITINSIPIYYLQPNKRISIFDNETGINGEYVISRISCPLQYNGMMSITATKAPENSVTEREE